MISRPGWGVLWACVVHTHPAMTEELRQKVEQNVFYSTAMAAERNV
jgi:hypothetical protein